MGFISVSLGISVAFLNQSITSTFANPTSTVITDDNFSKEGIHADTEDISLEDSVQQSDLVVEVEVLQKNRRTRCWG